MTKPHNTERRVERTARLAWVTLGLTRIPTMAQRELKPSRVDHIAVNMDLEQIGTPTVNKRNGLFYVLDGQHRIEAYKQWVGDDWADQQLQCWAYDGLSEEEEAETFLKINADILPVQAFERFRIGINAARTEEVEIAALVMKAGLTIAQSRGEGAIGAVGTLRRVYRREGPAVFSRALGLIRDAYGSPGLEAHVIDGIGLLCGRYNGELDTDHAVARLGSVTGGLSGLMNRAYFSKNQTNAPLNQCVAAGAVEIINRGKGGKKLPSWWKSDAA